MLSILRIINIIVLALFGIMIYKDRNKPGNTTNIIIFVVLIIIFFIGLLR